MTEKSPASVPWIEPYAWESVFPVRSLIFRLESLNACRAILIPQIAVSQPKSAVQEAEAAALVWGRELPRRALLLAHLIPEDVFAGLYERVCEYCQEGFAIAGTSGADRITRQGNLVAPVVRPLEALEAQRNPEVSRVASDYKARVDALLIAHFAKEQRCDAIGTSSPQSNLNELMVGCTQEFHESLNALADHRKTDVPGNARQPTANPDASRSKQVDQMADDGMFTVSDLAERCGVKPDALRKRLDRWRKKNVGSRDWTENEGATSREPKYLYRLGAVRPTIEELAASDEASGERPAKKKMPRNSL